MDTTDRNLHAAHRTALAREFFRALTGLPWSEWEVADQALYYRRADTEIAKGEDADWDVMREAALHASDTRTVQNAAWFRSGWDAARIFLDGRPDERDDVIARLRAELASERVRRGPAVDDF